VAAEPGVIEGGARPRRNIVLKVMRLIVRSDSGEVQGAARPREVGCARVEHRRAHVGVAEQLLHRSDVASALDQESGERVVERVADRGLRDAGPAAGPRESLTGVGGCGGGTGGG
jgi:hypothetical protein